MYEFKTKDELSNLSEFDLLNLLTLYQNSVPYLVGELQAYKSYAAHCKAGIKYTGERNYGQECVDFTREQLTKTISKINMITEEWLDRN